MTSNFEDYAQYYDLLYQDKDYVGEVEYLVSHISKQAANAKHILELGCGTGAHAEHLARMGYTVHGVDMSKEMLVLAEARKAELPADVAARLSFSLGDVRSVRIGKTYDVVISLFHVMSYQSSNDDLAAAFETAATHLSTDGLFLYDFWYGPAVLSQYPDTRVKRLENSKIKITRVAEPEMHVNENIVDVNYDIFIELKDTGEITQVQEKHKMRYLFLTELKWLQRDEVWSSYKSYEWLKNNELSENSWAAFIVATRK
ncbi:MAG: class I SAM-dependent methyltransferase [Pseudomonadota bacterium]|nr:class I SAM-dependent methyltransferase [Pseudomonadota bacterium]